MLRAGGVADSTLVRLKKDLVFNMVQWVAKKRGVWVCVLHGTFCNFTDLQCRNLFGPLVSEEETRLEFDDALPVVQKARQTRLGGNGCRRHCNQIPGYFDPLVM